MNFKRRWRTAGTPRLDAPAPARTAGRSLPVTRDATASAAARNFASGRASAPMTEAHEGGAETELIESACVRSEFVDPRLAVSGASTSAPLCVPQPGCRLGGPDFPTGDAFSETSVRWTPTSSDAGLLAASDQTRQRLESLSKMRQRRASLPVVHLYAPRASRGRAVRSKFVDRPTSEPRGAVRSPSGPCTCAGSTCAD